MHTIALTVAKPPFDDTLFASFRAPTSVRRSCLMHSALCTLMSRKRTNTDTPAQTVTKLLSLTRFPTIKRWKETETGFVFTAATPGLPKEDLVVEIVEATSRGGHYLVVSGESRAEAEGKQAQSFRAFYKRFEQKVKLPEGVDRNTLTAR